MSEAASPYSSFGLWLRQQRDARDLTQQALADLVGCSAETVRKIEKDERRPSRDMAELLAERLGVQPEARPELIRLARLGSPRQGAASDASPAPGRTSDDPALAARDSPLTNLPARRTSFVGREGEQARVRELLKRKDVRLLTLTGAPGIGKTQLSFQVASGMAAWFPDGVFVVFLSPVGNASLVVPAIVQALNVKEEPNRPSLSLLIEYLRDKQMLLLLDNFEHVVDARIFVVELLEACPRLKVLVSSRQVLNVYGEHEFSVPPLSLPAAEQPLRLDELVRYEAVDLFAQRSRAVKADFALTASDAPVVAEICRQLDGLPLAIELAAARSKLLSPRDMLKRLDSKLSLLTAGMRDLPARQQTLRAAIDWSHDLLDEHEKTLFRRMSVFVGGVTLDAIEAVAGVFRPKAEDPATAPMWLDTLDLVSSLVDKSLVRPQFGRSGLRGRGEEPDAGASPRSEPRFSMLWTIREYGLERLARSGEEQAIRRSHARFFLGLAEEALPFLRGSRQAAWLRRLEEERGNLRAALEWSSQAYPEMYARLVAALWRFWYVRGYLNEGRRWMEAALAPDKALPADLRARVCYGAAALATNQGDYARAMDLSNESLALCRESGDKEGIANALDTLGVLRSEQGKYADAKALFRESLALRRELKDGRGEAGTLNNLANVATDQGDYGQARSLLEEALETVRELEDMEVTAIVLNNLGHAARDQGDYEGARSLYEESLALKRRLGDKVGIGSSLHGLAEVARYHGDYDTARSLLQQGLSIFQELGDKEGIALVLNGLGHVARNQADYTAARSLYNQNLDILRTLGSKQDMALCLLGLAEVERAQGEPERATRLLGAVAALLDAIGATLEPADHVEFEANRATLRDTLDEAVFQKAWDAGQAMTPEQAIKEGTTGKR